MQNDPLSKTDTLCQSISLVHTTGFPKYFAQPYTNDTQDRIRFSQPAIPHYDSYHRVLKVPYKDFCASFKVRVCRVLFYASLVYQIVIDDELAITAGQVIALLARLVCILAGFTFSIIPTGTFQVLPLEVVYLMQNDGQYTTRPSRIRSSFEHIRRWRGQVFRRRVRCNVRRVHLHLWRRLGGRVRSVGSFFDGGALLEFFAQGSFFKVPNRPDEFPRHVVGIFESHQTVFATDHLVGFEHEFFYGDLDSAYQVAIANGQ